MAITAAAQKIWKGKEWFKVMAPNELGDYVIGETPTLDADSLVGKTIEASLMDLGGDPAKYFYKLKFRVTSVQADKAVTRLEGLSCTRDYVLRMSQRRTRQVRAVMDVKTKDGWSIRVKAINVMNGVVQSQISKRIRKLTEEMVKSASAQLTMYEFLNEIISGALQTEAREAGSKIYPVRIFEVTSIEVYSAAK
ncbi:MAG: hypothetical protein HY051_03965 [Candidatus Aenigmarchaeota archaeon]|nr:hypothetical protein [Candidatus Aenigmarchaeota archaeon]